MKIKNSVLIHNQFNMLLRLFQKYDIHLIKHLVKMRRKQIMDFQRRSINKKNMLKVIAIISCLSFITILCFNYSFHKRKTVPSFTNQLLESQTTNSIPQYFIDHKNEEQNENLTPHPTRPPKRTPRPTYSKYIYYPTMTMTMTPKPTSTPKRTADLDLLLKQNKEKTFEKNFPIDVVYTWVNGSDSKWLMKKHYMETKFRVRIVKSTEKSRYIDIGELIYSLRSVEKFLPWYNQIYIVTDNQIPNWINTSHPKIHFVDHTTIIPESSLPTFNSNNIEFHLSRIPNLTEHFIYLNDDVFIGKPCKPSDFFTEEGLPFIPVSEYNWSENYEETKSIERRKSIRNDMGSNQYRLTSFHSYDVFTEKFNVTVNLRTAHGYMPFTKSLIDFMWEAFPQELENLETHHFRDYTDVNIPSMSIFVGCGLGMAKPNFDANATSFLALDSYFMEKIENYSSSNFNSFCLNSGEKTSNHIRKAAVKFLKKYMPKKSSFEK